tara:strand:- start:5545 stop:6180 length:636 start_codon:yes stop_codon:yes gene_type:complete
VSVTARRTVGVVNYGVGNLGSITGALSRLGYRTKSGRTADSLAGCDALILPGVGAMPYAMNAMQAGGLAQFIRECYETGDKPMIGICLGMQLMFEHSEEGNVDALGILGGQVRRLPQDTCHVGWNLCASPTAADPGQPKSEWPNAAYYFNHSYYVDCDDAMVASRANLKGHPPLPAMVRVGPFTGLQFHPEKSQVAGTDLLRFLIERHSHD